MRRVLEGSTGRCAIVAGEPAEDALGALLPPRAASALVVITDGVVRALHGVRFPDAPVIELGQGEAAKNLATVEAIFERFLDDASGAHEHDPILGTQILEGENAPLHHGIRRVIASHDIESQSHRPV